MEGDLDVEKYSAKKESKGQIMQNKIEDSRKLSFLQWAGNLVQFS